MMTNVGSGQYKPSMVSRKPRAGVPLNAGRRIVESPSAPSSLGFPELTDRTGNTTMCKLLDEKCRTEIESRVVSASSLVVYAGLWANGDTWLQVDDVSITAL